MRKKIIMVCVVLLILAGAGGAAYFLRYPAPEKMLGDGLAKLREAESFSYRLTQQQVQGEETRELTMISGLRGGANVQIQGQVAGTNIEMIQLDQTLYNKDPFSGQWMKLEDADAMEEIFLVELDPLSVLQLKETGEIQLQGKEKVNGKNCLIYEVRPSVQNQIMERFWTDFVYTFYVGRFDHLTYKAEIKGKQKETGYEMKMILELRDFGKTYEIQAPI